MIRMSCDYCTAPIDRDTDPYWGLDAPIDRIEPHPDPVQAMNEADEQLVATLKVGFGGDHEYHFCSAGCLSTWALLKEATS